MPSSPQHSQSPFPRFFSWLHGSWLLCSMAVQHQPAEGSLASLIQMLVTKRWHSVAPLLKVLSWFYPGCFLYRLFQSFLMQPCFQYILKEIEGSTYYVLNVFWKLSITFRSCCNTYYFVGSQLLFWLLPGDKYFHRSLGEYKSACMNTAIAVLAQACVLTYLCGFQAKAVCT